MIKKIAAFVLMSTLFVTVAQARHHDNGGYPVNKNGMAVQGGGFKGPGVETTSIKNALDMDDDALVRLKGNIVKSLGDDQYVFKDATGTIEVEIDDKRWMGQTITPNDTVEIYGKIDKDILSAPEIDVKRIILIK